MAAPFRERTRLFAQIELAGFVRDWHVRKWIRNLKPFRAMKLYIRLTQTAAPPRSFRLQLDDL